MKDVEISATVAETLSRSPGAPVAVLNSNAWNVAPPAATELVSQLKTLDELRSSVSSHFLDGVLNRTHADDVEYIERKSEGLLSFLAFLDSKYRSIKKRWNEYRRPAYTRTLLEQAHDLREVDKLTLGIGELETFNAKGKGRFGASFGMAHIRTGGYYKTTLRG